LKSDSGISSTSKSEITSIVSLVLNTISQELSTSETITSLFPNFSVDFSLKILYHSNVEETKSFLSLSTNNKEFQFIFIFKSKFSQETTLPNSSKIVTKFVETFCPTHKILVQRFKSNLLGFQGKIVN
jgi:hypothetical protein